ncbi:MAG: class I SAM-dependent methyltransferase [Candidatus Jordarchaeaceae archaeon]
MNLLRRTLEEIREQRILRLVEREVYNRTKFLLASFYKRRIPYVIQKLRERVSKIEGVEELVDFAFNFRVELINITPSQVREEILELLKIVEEIKPKRVLEIGTANGGTLFLFSQVAAPYAMIISVDLPGGRFGGGYPEYRIPLYKGFAKKNQKIYLIRSDSHEEETFEKIKQILNGEKVDFLFIDGDHSYNGVKKDFEMYNKLAESVIALHDIVPGPEKNVGGVPKFWKEISKEYKKREIVKDWNQGGYGIGVIFL